MANNRIDVRLSKSFTLKGYWYLPNDDEHQIAGVLTYTPGGPAILELIGGFVGMGNPLESLRSLESSTSIPVIWGITSDGKPVTLFDCNVRTVSTNLSCPFPMETYSCHILLYGILLMGKDLSCIRDSFVEIPGIDCFLKDLPFAVTHHNDGSIEVKAASRKMDDCKNSITIDGVIFSLSNTSYWNTDFLETAVFKSRPTLSISSDKPYSIEELMKFSHLFIQFITIATLSATSCTRISFSYCINEQEKSNQSVEVIYAHHPVSVKPKIHETLLDYNSISKDYPRIIQSWFDEDEKLGPIKSHLIEVIIDRTHYTSSQFLLMIQAIEGYYSRYIKDGLSLSVLLKNLKEEFCDIARISSMNMDIAAIVDSRHYYSHFMPASKKPQTMYGAELAVATSQLRVMLICCLLRIMGFDNNRINEILKGCHNSLAEPIKLIQ